MGSFGLAARRSSASCTGGLTRGTLLTGSRRKGSVSIPCGPCSPAFKGRSTMPQWPLTILFMPESTYGPTNNCIGIGDVLRRRGHRVVFAAEASWQGKLEPLGFTEDLVNLAQPAETGPAGAAEDAGQFWKDFIASTAAEFRKPTIEQLGTWIRPVWEELIAGAKYSHDQLTDIVSRTAPDVIVEDNVVGFPALMTAGAPFVRIVSCNPLELKGPDVPPAFSGYPAADPGLWPEFRAEYDRVHRELWS